jgi:beta-glucuronidase
MKEEPAPEIMQNGLEQLREMIQRDRNHPSIFAWGLCNEIGGQNPPAHRFARRLYEEAKKLDPRRLRSYASNSLQKDPGKDVAGLMDFIEWNEYYESWYGGNVESVLANLEEIHRAFPDKPIVISEYGYCECARDRKPGDDRRVAILQSHDAAFRRFDWVSGAIFFCYNDYRTHMGDKGVGVLKQRVHGVVDVYGERKHSFDELRRESSPIDRLEVGSGPKGVVVRLQTRRRLPAYRLEGYKLRWISYGYENLPMEQGATALPALAPGDQLTLDIVPREKNPRRVRVDVLRPTGFSVCTAEVGL